jgi:1,4-dihydroxy-2-naphthoate octaprenyltransferase
VLLVCRGLAALAIGLVGVVASLGYAGGPFPYTKLGLAEPIFFVMFGVVAVAGTYFAQTAWLAAVISNPRPDLATLPLAALFVGLRWARS